MKKSYTKIVFVIDRSGSMSSIKTDMEGGLKNFLAEQKKAKLGKCDVSLYQFDDHYETVYESKDIDEVPDYSLTPRNMTALYDAVGKTINRVGSQLAALKEDDRPDRVMMVIITDGLENSSSEFTAAKIQEMVKHQTNKYNWQFSYLGSNQDAWAVGGALGIAAGSTMTYANNVRGIKGVWDSLNNATVSYRACVDANSAVLSYTAADVKEQQAALQEPTK